MEHQKDTRREETRNNGQMPQTYQGYGYIVRKGEKLTTALYLVTDILSDKEPMKWKAREVGVDVLSDITVAGSLTVSEKQSTLRIVLKKIDKLISFLDVATSTNLMSEMNSSMIRKEYVALKENIGAEWSRIQDRSKSLLSERFFEVRGDTQQMRIEESSPESTQRISERPQQHIASAEKGSAAPQHTNQAQIALSDVRLQSEYVAPKFTPSQPPRQAPAQQEFHLSKEHVNNGQKVQEEKLPIVEKRFVPSPQAVRSMNQPRPVIFDNDVIARSRPDVTRDDRRKIILALIKQKPAITVSDIAKSIPGISEKTIQRELLSMVGEGVLVKHGERRWSTYSLRDV